MYIAWPYGSKQLKTMYSQHLRKLTMVLPASLPLAGWGNIWDSEAKWIEPHVPRLPPGMVSSHHPSPRLRWSAVALDGRICKGALRKIKASNYIKHMPSTSFISMIPNVQVTKCKPTKAWIAWCDPPQTWEIAARPGQLPPEFLATDRSSAGTIGASPLSLETRKTGNRSCLCHEIQGLKSELQNNLILRNC